MPRGRVAHASPVLACVGQHSEIDLAVAQNVGDDHWVYVPNLDSLCVRWVLKTL
jgi:hypothetical protein